MTHTTQPQQQASSPPDTARPDPENVLRAISRRSFATLATSSPAGRTHAAGILYASVGSTLYIHTMRSSRKARNAAANPEVAVSIPIRRLPLGPPATVQFQGDAAVLAPDDPEVLQRVAAGELDSITSHGELDEPEGCFIRVSPKGRLVTYGLGMSLWRLLRDPLNAGGSVDLSELGR